MIRFRSSTMSPMVDIVIKIRSELNVWSRILSLVCMYLSNWVMNAYIVRVPFGVEVKSIVESNPNLTVSPLSTE